MLRMLQFGYAIQENRLIMQIGELMFKKFVSTCLIACTALTMLPVQNAFAKSQQTLSVKDAVDWAISTAADDSHGYSQAKRLGNPDYDCSSFTATAFKEAGFDIGSVSAINTRTMRTKFVAAGFKWIPASKINLSNSKNSDKMSLKTGDILLSEGSHVEIYVNDGGEAKRVGAHRDYDGKPGDSTGKEISVTKYSNFGCNGVLRWENNADDSVNTYSIDSDDDDDDSVDTFDLNLPLSKFKKTKTSITIKWDAVDDVTGYELSYSEARNGNYSPITVNAKTTSQMVDDLEPGTQYYFRIRAIKTDGDNTSYSTYSDILTASTSGVKKKNATVTAKSSLVLRKYAGTDADKVTSIKKGETIKISYVTKDAGGRTWYKASYKGSSKTYTGYVVSDYIEIEE